MIWWMWIIIILALIGLFVVLRKILRLVNFWLIFILEIILSLFCFIFLGILVVICADTFFNAGWGNIIIDWLQHIKI